MHGVLSTFNIFYIFLILWYSIHAKKCIDKFPKDFKFGVGTSAYQIEGGWNASGKGENIWDRLTHTHPEAINDRDNGDIACDSYHLWKTDVENLKYLGVHHYRFSLSWSRILPTGFVNQINKDGVEYYNNLINSLLANGIEPIVTLYHWDLPQTLQDLGGWSNVKTADYFADFVRVAFRLYGNRVKTWTTINEPYRICYDSAGDFEISAVPVLPGFGCYLCARSLLIAHSKAYHIYDKEFRKQQKGKIGIILDSSWPIPKTNKTDDIEAAERYIQMMLGWFAHPIFSKDGDYPEIMKKTIQERSAKENYRESRLPSFTKEEINALKGTSDYLGINHYETEWIENFEFPIGKPPSYFKDIAVKRSKNPKWKPSPDIVPWGFYKLLRWVAKEYNNPLVYITENGYGDNNSNGLQDSNRIVYLAEYMKAVLQAIQDGSNIKKYTVWSFMDNMEWRRGYSIKYGLFNVDFTSPNRTRTPKTSAKFYKQLIKTGTIPKGTVFQ
ncbi:hypothetical protein HHI36_016310 [Cryptolaemus montrouzieri]|uniref:Beta-glucosidase n=1 Tax=Cryptolaemus montrouzieri TaxID=559131 RepID=A0ABD2NK88_9CUCU